MAWVVLVGEGAEAESAMAAAYEDKKTRLRRMLVRNAGTFVLYDIQIARELVRDIKARMTGGKLFVFAVDAPLEVYEPGGGTPA